VIGKRNLLSKGDDKMKKQYIEIVCWFVLLILSGLFTQYAWIISLYACGNWILYCIGDIASKKIDNQILELLTELKNKTETLVDIKSKQLQKSSELDLDKIVQEVRNGINESLKNIKKV
jgi:hypothetical protein